MRKIEFGSAETGENLLEKGENWSNAALVAQLVEQMTLNHRVQGSSPCGGI